MPHASGPPPPTAAPTPTPAPTATPAPAAETYLFFNPSEAATIKAVFGQLIPGSAQDPGAVEAGAHLYTDHALAGPYSSQRTSYRRGIAAINAYSQGKYGQEFAKLSSDQQKAVLGDMQGGTATGFYAPAAAAFFATLVQHVREGTFSDPIYGGNRGLIGWKMGASRVARGPTTFPPATNHEVGGARMGDNPAKSVVNRNCQSHQLPNLFVTSGAVFPTYFGYNPTHTIEALSFRAGDFIKKETKPGGSLVRYM